MASSQQACWGSARACVLRVIRLDANCNFVRGSTAGVVTAGLVKLMAAPEWQTGQEYLQLNGCGDVCIQFKDCDRLKRMTLDIELCLRDLELLELLTGGQLFTDGNPITPHTIGMSRRGIGLTCQSPVSIEVWTKAVNAAGDCVPGTGSGVYWHWVYPKAFVNIDSVTHENNVGQVVLKGFGENNPNWYKGAFNDWPAAQGLDPTAAEAFVLDAFIPTTGCGYVTVPAAS